MHLINSQYFDKTTNNLFSLALCVLVPARHHAQPPLPTVQGELQVPRTKRGVESEDNVAEAMHRLRVTFNVSVGGKTGAGTGKNTTDFGVDLVGETKGNGFSSSSMFEGSRGADPATVSSSSKMVSKMGAGDGSGGTRRLAEKARLVSAESVAASSRDFDLCVS